jgi:acetoacetate decarboxylase
MPTHFGPAPGPRQMPPEANADPTRSPRKTLVTASFLTARDALERHLPPGFALIGEPVVTVEFHYMTDIDWLAGRGYTMIHVWWPAGFTGARDRADGRFLAVMWENLADPIISGREEVGHPKLYAEIPELLVANSTYRCAASWMGFMFLDVEVVLSDNAASAAQETPRPLDGTLMLKYLPRTEAWGEPDVCQVTFTPAANPDLTIERMEKGNGVVRFHSAKWAELPTLQHVVNALAALPILQPRGASVTWSRGGKPYLDQRVLE